MKLVRLAALSLVLVAGALATAGCGSPANFAGNYTVASTNDANACGFSGWMAGAMSSGNPAVITQAAGDSHATIMIGGGGGVLLTLIAGSATVSGTVSGSSATFTAPGTAAGNMGACHYFVTTTIDAQLSGDTLTGTVTLTPMTNGDPSCGVLSTCHNTIRFNGTRPPSM